MTLDVEGVVDGGMSGKKSLRRSGRLEALHSSLALTHRQVRILCPVLSEESELSAVLPPDKEVHVPSIRHSASATVRFNLKFWRL